MSLPQRLTLAIGLATALAASAARAEDAKFFYEIQPAFENCGDDSLARARKDGITLGVSQIPPEEIIDEKTGTIVIGEAVALRTAAITFGALTVEIDETPAASQPGPLGRGATKIVPHTQIKVEEAEGPLRMVKKSATVGDVAAALASLGAKPRDLVSILRALKAAGALRAELETL